MKRRQKEALAAASGACAGGCAAAVQLRAELAGARAEATALRQQIDFERSLRRGLTP